MFARWEIYVRQVDTVEYLLCTCVSLLAVWTVLEGLLCEESSFAHSLVVRTVRADD